MNAADAQKLARRFIELPVEKRRVFLETLRGEGIDFSLFPIPAGVSSAERDRLSYAFALVSVAAAMDIENGKILDVRVALGGVAHKPWRDPLAEAEKLVAEIKTRSPDAVARKLEELEAATPPVSGHA